MYKRQLVFLVSNKGWALSREKILQKVWNYDYYGEDRTVDTHVKMLRSHLGKYRDNIVTVWGLSLIHILYSLSQATAYTPRNLPAVMHTPAPLPHITKPRSYAPL